MLTFQKGPQLSLALALALGEGQPGLVWLSLEALGREEGGSWLLGGLGGNA